MQEVLGWIISSGGAGVLAYWLMEHIPFLVALSAEWKRYASFVLSGAIACLAFVALVFSGFEPQPATWQAWVDALLSVIAGAVIVAQGAHARLKLSKR